jgi:hypothetical protein
LARRAPRAHGWAMRSLLAGLYLSTVGCVQFGTDTGPDSGSKGASTVTSPTPADASPTGSQCTEDPAEGITLCETIDLCPGLGVDPSVFANCGFRVGGPVAIDLECLCGTSLCPIGVPTSCSGAAQLLAAQTALTVCEQVSEGRCIQFRSTDSGSAASSCSSQCQTDCAGVPDCLLSCGC